MKVAHLTSLHRRYDTRVYLKECTSIAESGIDVYLIVADGNGDEVKNGINIIDIGQRSKNRLKKFISSSYKIYKKALRLNCDIYHFHDPELMVIGLFLKRKGKKVIFDVHENVAEQIKSKSYIPEILRGPLSKIYKYIENKIIVYFDVIITVTEGVARYIDHKNVIIVKNLPIISIVDNTVKNGKNNNEFVVIYPGSLSETRGIYDLVQATNHLQGKIQLKLYGRWQSEKLKEKCMSHEGWKYVEYGGVVAPEKVYSLIKSADLGVHMVHDISNYQGGLPVKVFEYMACKIPCIVSDIPSKRDLLNDLVFYAEPNAPKKLADEIEVIIGNDILLNEKVQKARTFVEGHSWEKESIKLLKLYKELV